VQAHLAIAPSEPQRLYAQVATKDNAQFRRNAANRLWALLLGRGLVHPLDMDHPANPPSHPELLNLLADDLAAHRFDVRYFLRELALSQVYQRSSELPPGVKAGTCSGLPSLKTTGSSVSSLAIWRICTSSTPEIESSAAETANRQSSSSRHCGRARWR